MRLATGRRWGFALGLVLAACGPTQGSDGDGGAGSTGPVTSTDPSGEDDAPGTDDGAMASSSAADDGTSQGDADDTGGASTGDPPTLCEAACVTFQTCGGRSPSCVAECEATLRFRDDHFGEQCVAAVEASYACFAELTCMDFDSFACEEAGVEQLSTCEGDVDAGPSVAAFCEGQVACGVEVLACELSILDDFMSVAYVEGCEVQYATLLDCVTDVGCMAPREEVDSACAAEVAALDGCDIFGG